MQQKYGTKSLKEYVIKDKGAHLKYVLEALPELNAMEGKNVLVFCDLPVAEFLSIRNRVTYLTTTKHLVGYTKHTSSSINTMCIREEEMFNLDKTIKIKQDMDYIFANPPYLQDLFLDISEYLLTCLNDDRSVLNVLSPTACVDNPFYTQYIQSHRNLFQHCTDVKKVNDGMKGTFDSYNAFSSLGIYTFVNTPCTNVNPYSLWKKTYTPEEIRIFAKVRKAIKNGLPTLKSKTTTYSGRGVLVPLSSIGGRTKKSAVMKTKRYVSGNKVLSKKDGIIDERKHEGEPLSGILFNTVDDAVAWWRLYDSNPLLKGLFVMSLGGSQNPHYSIVPYFKDADTKEIKHALELDSQDVKVLTALSKNGPIKYGDISLTFH